MKYTEIDNPITIAQTAIAFSQFKRPIANVFCDDCTLRAEIKQVINVLMVSVNFGSTHNSFQISQRHPFFGLFY